MITHQLNKFPEGVIIAFEGLDCCFKETNYQNFVKYLRQRFSSKHRFIMTDGFPRYDEESSYGVKAFLNNSIDSSLFRENNKVEAICAPYAIDRMHYWHEFINVKDLDYKFTRYDLYEMFKYCFIFDRYNISNAIYNPINGSTVTVEDLRKEELEYLVPMPDIVVWMRMGDWEAYKNILNKRKENKAAGTSGGSKDVNESNLEYMHQVWLRSEEMIKSEVMAKAGIKLIVVDCLTSEGTIKSREDIAGCVISQISEYCNRMKRLMPTGIKCVASYPGEPGCTDDAPILGEMPNVLYSESDSTTRSTQSDQSGVYTAHNEYGSMQLSAALKY